MRHNQVHKQPGDLIYIDKLGPFRFHTGWHEHYS